MVASLQKRLAELERNLSDLERESQFGKCVCQKLVMAYDAEQLETEINLPCPCHGLRRLGTILQVAIVDAQGRTDEEKQAKLSTLVKQYESRLAQAELEYDPTEL